jgi:flagellar hook assembly protein FlgD
MRDRLHVRFLQSSPGAATLTIFATDGRRVAAPLCFPNLGTGIHELAWDGADQRGIRVPSGAYIARLVAPGLDRSWSFVLSK